MNATGEPNRAIANATGLNIRTIQKWVERLDKNPDAKSLKVGRKKNPNLERRREIELLINSNNSLTAVGIQELLPPDNKCSIATIKRELVNMGYSRKRLKPIVAARNSAAVIAQRFSYCARITSLSNNDLIFLDETGFNLHESPHYGYAPIGSTPYITVPTQRGRNISLICAINITGVLSYKFQVGAFNAIAMAEWCQSNLMPSLGQRRCIIIMDNARFHHSSIVEETLQRNNSSIMFLPPYSPQLNPIEEFFGVIKRKYVQITPRPRNTQEMINGVETILITYSNTELANYYARMREWVTKGIQRLEFI